MAQGTSQERSSVSAKAPQNNWDNSSKKSGYEAIQKMEREKKEAETKKANSYGAWGPTFKNKDNFSNMHHC